MKNILILFAVIIVLGLGVFYISFFSDFALPEQGCDAHIANVQHGNKTCIPPFTCKKFTPDASGGICSL